ncbi:MAG: TIGR01777 family oxidoreductase [Desulfovibrionaceae bacterium]
MNILILGGTGLIGSALLANINNSEHVTVLSRNPEQYRHTFPTAITLTKWNDSIDDLIPHIETHDTIINLLGENIANGRWTNIKKQNLYSSRVHTGQKIVTAIERSSKKPQLLIQASAVGYYGPFDNIATAPVLEEHSNGQFSFLSSLAKEWENSTKKIEELGIRRCIIRTSGVLTKKGGLLPKILPPFKFFMGGYPLPGTQPISWIHIEDEVNAILHCIYNTTSHGAYNLVAPNVVSMKEFCATLAETIHKPLLFPVPQFIIRLLVGEMANELILTGQNVSSKKLQAEGFVFKYPTLKEALANLLL